MLIATTPMKVHLQVHVDLALSALLPLHDPTDHQTDISETYLRNVPGTFIHMTTVCARMRANTMNCFEMMIRNDSLYLPYDCYLRDPTTTILQVPLLPSTYQKACLIA